MLTRSAFRRSQLTTPSASSSPELVAQTKTRNHNQSESVIRTSQKVSRVSTKSTTRIRKSAKMRSSKVQCGNITKTLNKDCMEMTDSTELYTSGDFQSLRLRLERDGYLFVRQVIPKDLALKARKCMLRQAYADGSVLSSRIDGEFYNDEDLMEARISHIDAGKSGKSKRREWAQGYCFDGLTGVETNERMGIDVDKWQQLCQSTIMRNVYNGPALKTFWANIFGGVDCVDPLVSQTFIRLMGSSATQEHADYYYFKRDTDVFSQENHVTDAMDAAYHYTNSLSHHDRQYTEDIPASIATMLDTPIKTVPKRATKGILEVPSQRMCVMCGRKFKQSQIEHDQWMRASVGDFGTALDSSDGSERWHCPDCAAHDLAVYTTWVSLSELQMPTDSALCISPSTHRLRGWDYPLFEKQLPGDFVGRLSKWCVPYELSFGDVILFNIKTVHASTLNRTNPRCFRLSCDTRIQLTMPMPMVDDHYFVQDQEEEEKEVSVYHGGKKKRKAVADAVIDDSHASPKKKVRKSPKKKLKMTERMHGMMTRSQARAAAVTAEQPLQSVVTEHYPRRMTRAALRAVSVDSDTHHLRDEFERLGF